MRKKLFYIIMIASTLLTTGGQHTNSAETSQTNTQASEEAPAIMDPSEVLSSEQNEKMNKFFEQFENADTENQSPEDVFEQIFEELAKPENEDVLNAINAYGEAIYESMPEDQKQELMSAFEQGFDQSTQENNQQPKQAEQQPTPQGKPVSGSSQEQIRITLYNLIQLLESIQQKAASSSKEEYRLQSWQEAINDLLYYIKIMNKREHYQRLASKEFTQLLDTIKNLQNKLAQYEPQFTIPEILADDDDPYAILGITPSASQKEIEATFQQLKAEKSPEGVKKQLEQKGIQGKERQRAIKEAEISFPVIEDAYEKLTDSKMRQQIDRTRSEQMKHKTQAEQNAQQAVKNITQALSEAIYGKELLAKIENFLKQYEPEELKKKKAMEQAQKERATEQRRTSTRPSPRTQAPSRLEPRVRPGRPKTRQDFDFGSYPEYDFSGGDFDNRFSSNRDTTSPRDKSDQKDSMQDGKKGQKGTAPSSQEQDKQEEEKGAPRESGKNRQQTQITLSRRIDNINKQLKKFEEAYKEQEKSISQAVSKVKKSQQATTEEATDQSMQQALTKFAEDANIITSIEDSLPDRMKELRQRLEDIQTPKQYKKEWVDKIRGKKESIEKVQKQFAQWHKDLPQYADQEKKIKQIKSQLDILNQEFNKITKLLAEKAANNNS